MFTCMLIRKFVQDLPVNQIFTSRDVLAFGARSAIDTELARLVRSGRIVRIARGVFVKEGSNNPSMAEIAEAKARAFGKVFVSNFSNPATDPTHRNQGQKGEMFFGVSGRTSSFRVNGQVVSLKGVGPRKVQLGNSKSGQVLRALWNATDGSANVPNSNVVRSATVNFDRRDYREFKEAAVWLPARLSDELL